MRTVNTLSVIMMFFIMLSVIGVSVVAPSQHQLGANGGEKYHSSPIQFLFVSNFIFVLVCCKTAKYDFIFVFVCCKNCKIRFHATKKPQLSPPFYLTFQARFCLIPIPRSFNFSNLLISPLCSKGFGRKWMKVRCTWIWWNYEANTYIYLYIYVCVCVYT